MTGALLPCACVVWLLGLWYVNSRLDGSSISPASLFLGYWFFGAACPLVAWLASLLLLQHTAGYLFLAVIATTVFLASFFFRPYRRRITPPPAQVLGSSAQRRLLGIYPVALLLALLYPVGLYWQARETLGVQSLLEMPGVVSEARYTVDWNPGTFVNGLNTFVFVAAALSGFLAANRPTRKRHRLVILSGLLPGVLTYYLTAARTGLLFSAVFWLASYITCATFLGQSRQFSFSRFFRAGLLLTVLVLPVVHVGYMVRTGTYSWAESKGFWEKSLSTAFGHMPVLGYWLESDDLAQLPPFELKSFAGLTEKVGLAKREQGLYEVSYAVGADESLSNIYTSFRPLVEDGRGVVGGCLLLFLAAGAANLGWHYLRRGRIQMFPVVFAFQVYVLWSLITSIYIYLSTLLAVTITCAVIMHVLFLNRKAAAAAGRLSSAAD